MQQITITTYKFNELSEEAKKRAIEDQRKDDFGLLYGAWYGDINSEWETKLNKIGYENVEIFFSGFSSQGDGACFIAKIDLVTWLKTHKLSNKYRSLFNEANDGNYHIIEIKHSNRYYYATSTTVEDTGSMYIQNDKTLTQFDEVIKLIEQERESIGNKIYKELKELYYHLTSDDVIADYLSSNEYDFLADGRREYFV